MSPEAITADRVYHDLKQQIMSGQFKPGASIGLASTAEMFGTSISPVRDALHRLVGERIVDTIEAGGFSVPSITSRTVQQLYGWHADIVRVALKAMTKPERIGPFPGLRHGEDAEAIAAVAAELFERIGFCSANPEHHAAIISAGQRLHPIRLKENLLQNIASELETLWNVTRSANKTALRLAMWHYHRRRLLKAKQLCAAAGGSIGNGKSL